MAKEPKKTTDQETGANAPDPVVERKPDKEYFEIVGSRNKRFVRPDGNIIDLRFGVPKNALELYKEGKKYLGLKKGAEILFSDEPKEVIEKLIEKVRKEDVAILKKALK